MIMEGTRFPYFLNNRMTAVVDQGEDRFINGCFLRYSEGNNDYSKKNKTLILNVFLPGLRNETRTPCLRRDREQERACLKMRKDPT